MALTRLKSKPFTFTRTPNTADSQYFRRELERILDFIDQQFSALTVSETAATDIIPTSRGGFGINMSPIPQFGIPYATQPNKFGWVRSSAFSVGLLGRQNQSEWQEALGITSFGNLPPNSLLGRYEPSTGPAQVAGVGGGLLFDAGNLRVTDALLAFSAMTADDGDVMRYQGGLWGGQALDDLWDDIRTDASVSGALPTDLGGTGLVSYSPGDLLYANVSSTLSRLPEPGLPGYMLMANLGLPTWVQLSTQAVTTLTGTANQVLVNGTSGSGQTGPVTLTLPQNMHTGASPQFAGLALVGAAGANLLPTMTSPSGFGTFLNFGPSATYVEFGTSSAGDYTLSHNGVAGGVFKSMRSGSVGDTLVLDSGVVKALSLNVTGVGGANLITKFISPSTFGSFLQLGVLGSLLELSAASNGDFALTFNGLVGGAMRAVRSGAVGDTLVLESGSIRTQGSLTTAAPSGGTAQPWKLGNYTAGAAAQVGKVRVEINGTPYDLLTA